MASLVISAAAVTPTATTSVPPPPATDIPPDPAPVATTTPAWETFDELTHATRNFAQFFNGAIVNLEGTNALAEDGPALDEKLGEPDWEETELS
jgi:hypothetical protein